MQHETKTLVSRSPSTLKKSKIITGRAYFLVTYLDQELVTPKIETLYALNSEAFEEIHDGLYFQLAEKFIDLGPYKAGPPDEHGVVFINNDSLDCVHDYDSLQQEIEYMKNGGARYYP